ncbi:hypothetical protein AFIC_002564 [[Pseudomonas] carboxydohydrogena]|uniref:Abi-like protein n=1 Tax=Afipia carboxydohydrogena TaxID=290 RepID=A0ABY8BRR0_AFICR|nr:hypothetical protein [[Pseudomonas] carboxydohydrogena]WEF51002.1 hypothetical protein AFIC_002564 [[Pseudomonas] carboxydohydrogena]
MAESQEHFPYHETGFQSLSTTLSEPRLSTYLTAAAHNPERAFKMYLWNARLSKALRFPLEVTEITVRNRIHYALCDRWGNNWPNNPDFARVAAEKTKERLDVARRDLGVRRQQTDRIVAALSFGFWTALLKGRFVESMWRGRVERFFPHLPNDLDFHAKVATLADGVETSRNLRNRIGHLEPIFATDLSLAHSQLVKLVGYGCRSTSKWMKHHSTLDRVLREGSDPAIKDEVVYAKSKRNFVSLPEETPLAAALTQLSATTDGFIVSLGQNHRVVVTLASVGNWICSQADDGIFDIGDWRLGDVSRMSANTPVVSRRSVTSEFLASLWKTSPHQRYAIITERGRDAEATLGVADLHSLLQ